MAPAGSGGGIVGGIWDLMTPGSGTAGGKIASSFIVMAIVGGAFFPLIMGWISDATGGNIQLAYVVPIFCFAFILLFALKYKSIAPAVKEEKLVLTH